MTILIKTSNTMNAMQKMKFISAFTRFSKGFLKGQKMSEVYDKKTEQILC